MDIALQGDIIFSRNNLFTKGYFLVAFLFAL